MEELQKLKEQELNRLHILRDKKGKSIAGEVPGDKHLFEVENDVIEEEKKDPVDIKKIRFRSHDHFTYFRGADDNLAKYTIMEEEILALREIAARKKQEIEEAKRMA